MRDPVTHDSHCSFLSGALGSEDSVTYGINGQSPLNLIPGFHVANSQLPQDVMHVILEGLLPMETILMLASFMENGYFTLNMLNNRVSNFAYGRVEGRNKPPKPFQKAYFTGNYKLHLSGESL